MGTFKSERFRIKIEKAGTSVNARTCLLVVVVDGQVWGSIGSPLAKATRTALSRECLQNAFRYWARLPRDHDSRISRWTWRIRRL